MKRTLGRACLLLLAMGASACAPETSSNVRMKGQPVDVVFGDKKTPAPAPVVVAPGANFQPHFPSLIEPHLPDFDDVPDLPTPLVLPTATPKPCPTAPRPGLKEVAPPRITKRPAVATYTFARTGSAQRTLPTSGEIRLDGLVVREYSGIRPGDPALDGAESFLFDVKETSGDAVVVNTYLVSPQGAAPGGLGAGLYLQRIESTVAGGGTDVFAPVRPLQLMPFPAQEKATWHTTATDPRSQVTMDLDGLIRGKKRLNFCGQGVETWDVELKGTIAGPGKLVNISSLVIDVGSQYGGVLLQDELVQTGTDTDGQYRSTSSSTITKEPDAGS